MTATTTRAAETWAHMTAAVDPMPVCVALDYAQEGVELAEACASVEAVAQAHLDAHPDDHAARRLLGEWLTACGDERGEGLTALGACGLYPRVYANAQWYDRSHQTGTNGALEPWSDIPDEWFGSLDGGELLESYLRVFDARQAAENAAARAFLRLPRSRREQLLKGEM